jgi:hypothetical protein
MLNLLPLLFAEVMSEAASWDPASLNVITLPARDPLFTPAEPTTLTLAVLGIGLIGVYSYVRKIQQYKRKVALQRAELLKRRWQPKSVRARDAA